MDSIGRTSITLLAVLVLIFVCVWALRKLGWQRRSSGGVLRLVETRSFGPRERIVVIELNGEWLVLGMTAQQINLLTRLPAPATTAACVPYARELPAFGAALARSLARFRREHS